MVREAERLSLKEVAQELGRSLEQVRRYVREGKLPAEKLGMQWFVDRDALNAFLNPTLPPWKVELEEIRNHLEGMRQKYGLFNVDEMLDRSREGHP